MAAQIAVPAAAASTMITRLGPWLRSMGSSAGNKAADAVSRATGLVFKSVDDVINYARQGPLQATTVLTSVAGAGMTVSDLLSPDDKRDPEVRQAAFELERISLSPIEERAADAAAVSEVLEGISGNRSDLELLRELCRWAVAHYGSRNAALRAHSMNQAFFELSYEDVQVGMDILV